MQMKKKATGRSNVKELGNPKSTKHLKKVPEDVQIQGMKVSELITSSARKSGLDGTHPQEIRENVDTTNLNSGCQLADDGASPKCSGVDFYHASNYVSLDSEICDGTTPCVMGTIFSPAFHVSRGGGGEIAGRGGDGLSSELSAIYQSAKLSKLECVDEGDHDRMPHDVHMEEDACEEYEEFDPYFFIKNLPELSSIVPTFRPVLLPKQTRSCPPTTLVLDLDETLVHSTLEPSVDADFTFSVNFNLVDHTVFVRCRPHLKDFMEKVSSLFEIIIFTASQSIYAEQLLNFLDPKRKIFRHRVYRDSCVYVDGNYLKDLSVLGRDLAHVVMVDNSPQAFGFQVDNGIPIESWFDDRSDQELLSLLPFLESLIGVEDVRPLIAKKFNLREKIATAVCPLSSNLGDPFDR